MRSNYDAQIQALYKSIELDRESPNADKMRLQKFKTELDKFDSEKEIHFKNHKNITCLVGIESLDILNWMWSDGGLVLLYILDKDLHEENFENVVVTIDSA